MNNTLIANIISKNLIEIMSQATHLATDPHAGTSILNGSLRYFTGCDFPFFNGIFHDYQQQNIFEYNLAELTEFFAEKKKPFIWWWLQNTEIPSTLKKQLTDLGFQPLGDFLGIAAKLDQVKLINPSEMITIKKVENYEEFLIFIKIMCTVFQLNDVIKKDFENIFNSYGDNGIFNHYLGFYQEQPVATLTSYIKNNIVGLYNGSTLLSAQKKGLCTTLASVALNAAIHSKCEFAISQLMPPSLASGLAEQMGFKQFCKMQPFIWSIDNLPAKQ